MAVLCVLFFMAHTAAAAGSAAANIGIDRTLSRCSLSAATTCIKRANQTMASTVDSAIEGKTSHFRAAQDGSMELADEKGNALAVDLSGASGAVAMVAHLGKAKPFRANKAKVAERRIVCNK